LVAAWCILENLAVSFDQIGGALSDKDARLAALARFINPDLVRQINEARARLGRYLPDDEAAALAETAIPYWDYDGAKDAK
jgi:hypothetical protein